MRFASVYVLFVMIFAGWLVWQHRQDFAKAWVPEPRTKAPPLGVLAIPAAAAAADGACRGHAASTIRSSGTIPWPGGTQSKRRRST